MSGGGPRAAGFRMPAEWTAHRRCWIAWPGERSIFARRGRLAEARRAFAETARAIARFEPVALWTNPADRAGAEALRAADAGRIEVVEGASEDCWMRDSGPTFLAGPDGATGAVAWRFNGYGGKYPGWERDAEIAAGVARRAGARLFRSRLACEGGAVHADGEGTVLTTASVLLNPNRNPGWTRAGIEAELACALGARRTVWLAGGLVQDEDTDGHVDTVACFLAPGRVLAQVAGDRADPNRDGLARNLEILRAARDAAGRPFEIVEIVQPRRAVVDGAWLPLSYVNFALAGARGAVVPVFDAPEDEAALAVLADAMPEREIVPLPAIEIFRGGGGPHCITQREPAA